MSNRLTPNTDDDYWTSVQHLSQTTGSLHDDLNIKPADIVVALLSVALALADEHFSGPSPVERMKAVLDDINKAKIGRN